MAPLRKGDDVQSQGQLISGLMGFRMNPSLET
jgi:hypothetical protein